MDRVREGSVGTSGPGVIAMVQQQAQACVELAVVAGCWSSDACLTRRGNPGRWLQVRDGAEQVRLRRMINAQTHLLLVCRWQWRFQFDERQ